MKFKRIDLKLIRYKIKSNCKMKIDNKKDLKIRSFFVIVVINLLFKRCLSNVILITLYQIVY